MKRVVWAVTLSAAAMLIPAQAFAQKVNVDFDPAAQFSTYKTYAWPRARRRPIRLAKSASTRQSRSGWRRRDSPSRRTIQA